jgi:hypothetical protein
MMPCADSLTADNDNAMMFVNLRIVRHAVVAADVPVGWSLP